MFRTLTASAAALALSLQAAAASPFGASVSAGETDRAERAAERQGVVSFVLNRVAVMIVGKAAHAGEGSSQYQYYTDEECEGAETPTEKAPEEEKAKKNTEPMGPEPIYYGF